MTFTRAQRFSSARTALLKAMERLTWAAGPPPRTCPPASISPAPAAIRSAEEQTLWQSLEPPSGCIRVKPGETKLHPAPGDEPE